MSSGQDDISAAALTAAAVADDKIASPPFAYDRRPHDVVLWQEEGE
jgi:hypothetical protein